MEPFMFDLTAGQIAAFHRDGYLTLDAITTQEEVARMRLIYDQLFAARRARGRSIRSGWG
jgi:hypothetical protein